MNAAYVSSRSIYFIDAFSYETIECTLCEHSIVMNKNGRSEDSDRPD